MASQSAFSLIDPSCLQCHCGSRGVLPAASGNPYRVECARCEYEGPVSSFMTEYQRECVISYMVESHLAHTDFSECLMREAWEHADHDRATCPGLQGFARDYEAAYSTMLGCSQVFVDTLVGDKEELLDGLIHMSGEQDADLWKKAEDLIHGGVVTCEAQWLTIAIKLSAIYNTDPMAHKSIVTQFITSLHDRFIVGEEENPWEEDIAEHLVQAVSDLYISRAVLYKELSERRDAYVARNSVVHNVVRRIIDRVIVNAQRFEDCLARTPWRDALPLTPEVLQEGIVRRRIPHKIARWAKRRGNPVPRKSSNKATAAQRRMLLWRKVLRTPAENRVCKLSITDSCGRVRVKLLYAKGTKFLGAKRTIRRAECVGLRRSATLQSGSDFELRKHDKLAQEAERAHMSVPQYCRHVREIRLRSKANSDLPPLWKDMDKIARKQYINARRDAKYERGTYQSAWRDIVIAGSAAVSAGALVYGVNSALRKSAAVSDSVSGFISDLRKNIASVVKQYVPKWCSSLCWGIIAGVMLWTLTTCSSFHPLADSRTVLLVVLGSVICPYVWRHIKNDVVVWASEKVELQSFGPSLLSKIISTAFCLSVFRGKFGNKEVTELMKRLGTFERSAEGLDVFKDWVVKGIETMVNWVRKCFGKERVSFVNETHAPLMSWAKQVDALVLQSETVSGVFGPNMGPESVNLVVSLLQEGYGYREAYRGTKLHGLIGEHLGKLTTVLQPYQGSLNARNNFRFEPLAVMLRGAPGVGKTTIVAAFCGTLLKLGGIIPPEADGDTVLSSIWQKGQSEYWNSYANQPCVVMDDAFQRRANLTSDTSDYLDIIRMVGSWAFPLNFADLPSKGKIFFSSKLVVGTTNAANLSDEINKVLIEPSAVGRRLEHTYDIKVKPEFAGVGGMLDWNKYSAALNECKGKTGLDAWPWHIWTATKFNILTGTYAGVSCELKDIILQLSHTLRSRAVTFGDTESSLKAYFSSVSPVPDGEMQMATFGDTVGTMYELYHSYVKSVFHPSKPFGSSLQTGLVGGTLCAAIKTYVAELNQKHKLVDKFLYCIAALAFVSLVGLLLDVVYSVWVYFRGSSVDGSIVAPRCLPLSAATASAKIKKETGVEVVRHGSVLKPSVVLQSGSQARNVKGAVDPQSALLTASNDLADAVYSNQYELSVRQVRDGVTTEQRMGSVLFLESTLFLQPTHFRAKVDQLLVSNAIGPDDLLVFKNAVHSRFQMTVPVVVYLGFPRFHDKTGEVQIVNAIGFRASKKITGRFISEADIKTICGKSVRLDAVASAAVDGKSRVIYYGSSVGLGTNLDCGPSQLSRYWHYDCLTFKGDCGGALCLADPREYGGKGIIGMHVALVNSQQRGASIVVTRELIDEAAKALKAVRDDFLEDAVERGVNLENATGELQDGLNCAAFVDKIGSDVTSFLPIGRTSRVVHTAPKTKYQRTLVYGAFGPYLYQPAVMGPVMRNGELVYPMVKALEPYSGPSRMLHLPMIEQAAYVAYKPLFHKTRDVMRRIYTFEEAVLGVPGDKFRSIPRGTGAGYPYNSEVKDGKKWFFGDGEVYDLTGPLCATLRERVSKIIDKARSGTRLCHIFMDFLKDELRSDKKVDQVATRLISSAPLDYVVAWRMYFGCFSAAVMRNHTVIGMAPGICPYSDWTRLASELKSKGSRVFDGDFKGFDSSELPTVMQEILKVINAWYDDGDDNARIRQVLFEDLVHSRHLGGLSSVQQFVYQWNKSLPSGHPFTTIMNSMYSLLVIVYAYMFLTRDKRDFWEHVYVCTYGDDNICNVDDKTSDVFNQMTLGPVLGEIFFMNYTPATKDDNWIPYTQLTRCSFLKRGFSRRDDGSWACPLELDSFLYTVYWCKNQLLRDEILRCNLETALEELSLHTNEVWGQYYPQIKMVCGQLKHIPKACNKEAYEDIVRSRDDAWY